MKYTLLVLSLLASVASAQDDVWKSLSKGDRVQITFRSGNMIMGTLDHKPADPRLKQGTIDYSSVTELTLDVAPLGEHHVRVFFHPVRYAVFGGRTSLGYLSGSLRRAVIPDLNSAFARQGFVVLGTSRERDEEAVEE